MPILDNFDSQYINDASETTNGLMSLYDKTKLDNIKLSDVDYIKNGLNEIKEYRVPQFIYGIKIDPDNPDPNTCVTYTDNATGFIPLTVNQSTGVCNYGSWSTVINDILGVKPCLVKKNGSVLSYLNPNDYSRTVDGNITDITTGEFGQVMIRFKHIYYKFSMDGNKIWFQISNKQNDDTWIDTAFASEDGIGTVKQEMFVAAYESSLVNNTLQSLSNKLPSQQLSFESIESLSEFGVFHMMNIVRKQFIIFLGYLVTKSIDLKGKIGRGNTGTVIKSGTMNTRGLFYGKSNNTEGVKLFGIENLWGNQLKYMHGIVQKMVYILDEKTKLTIPEQHLYIKEFYPYNKIEDFDDCGKIQSNQSGYISGLKFLNRSIYIPSLFNGSTSTYYKSYYQNGESEDASDRLYGIYGGSTVYGDKIGPEFLMINYLDKHLEKKITDCTTHIIY